MQIRVRFNVIVLLQIGENFLAKEHTEMFIEKVAEIIKLVKENPEQALLVAQQHQVKASYFRDWNAVFNMNFEGLQ